MVDTSPAIEPDLGDTLLKSPLTNEPTDELSRLLVGAELAGLAKLRAQSGGRADGLAVCIIDHLRVDVRIGAVNSQARTLCGAEDLGADAALPTLECFALCLFIPSPSRRRHLTG